MGKFISLFAGVGGFDLGMEKAGHECVAQVEWDKNAAGVLKHRWPNVPLFCDVSKVSADDLPDADFITYGFPCQDLSVAGQRKGLDGKRSGLFYEATRIIKQLAERAIRRGGAGGGRFIAIAENVRGLLSSGDGYDFARCIRELHNIGASEVGWSVLDSQYLGVAQRRKRVFLVADFGGESTSEILAFSEGVSGHPAPSREAGKGTARDATKGVGEGGEIVGSLAARDYKGVGNQYFNEGKVIAQNPINLPESDIVGTLSDGAHMGGGLNGQDAYMGRIMAVQGADVYNGELTGETSATVTTNTGVSSGSGPKVIGWNGDTTPKASEDVSQGVDVYSGELTGQTACTVTSATGISNATGPKVIGWNGDTTPKASEDVSVTLRSQQGGEGVGVAHVSHGQARECKDVVPPLMAHSGPNRHGEGSASTTEFTAVTENLTVRRLTPIECERLQGFPDNWTAEKMELTLEGNEWKATGKVVKQADGPRYKQMGNAITVNVGEWIGKQIAKVL